MSATRGLARYLSIAVVAIVSLAAYVWAVSSMAAHQRTPYSLDTLVDAPIPKWEFFSLWNDSIASSCNTVAKQLGMDTTSCRTAIVGKRMECYQHIGASAPNRVADYAVAQDLSRKYMQCVTPYQYCQALSGRSSPLEALCATPTRSARTHAAANAS